MNLRAIIKLATELRGVVPEQREDFLRVRRHELREEGAGINDTSSLFADAIALLDFVDSALPPSPAKMQRAAYAAMEKRLKDGTVEQAAKEAAEKAQCAHVNWHDTHHAGRICDDCGEEI